MILQTDFFKKDLSLYGVSLKIKSLLFTDNIYESYSLPFVISDASDIIAQLGLPTLNNVIETQSAISGMLMFYDDYFKCKFYINSHKKNKLKCRLTFADNKPDVFKLKLKDLRWTNIFTLDFHAHAEATISQSWPETPCQFPMIYDPGIAEKDDYEKFQGFINNYYVNVATSQTFTGFVENEYITETVDGQSEDVPYNRNVMKPCVYLLEILRQGYRLTGKQVIGDFINDQLIKKIVYNPESFIENFDSSQNQTFIFSQPDSYLTIGPTRNKYVTTFNPQSEGTYKLNIKVNLPSSLAANFYLKIEAGDETVKLYESNLSRVNIDDDLEVNIDNVTSIPDIEVTLIIPFTTTDIAEYNSFEIASDDGKLNIFPNFYNLANFMPDMKFGEFVNFIKNWFNLDIQTFDSYVKIDFLEDNITNRAKVDHEHLKVDDAEFISNENKAYKLTYSNDEQVIVARQGEIFDELNNDTNQELVEINIDAKPLISEFNKQILTAFDSGDRSKFDFMVYEGDNYNRVASSGDLFIQQLYQKYWKKWLRTRINSKTIKDKFTCSIHEKTDINFIYKKYNELIIPKEINKKIINKEAMEVDFEGETL